MPGMDPDTLRHALRTAREFGFRSVRIKEGDESFSAVLDPSEMHEPDEPISLALVPSDEPLLREIEAPVVGYFQSLAEPLKAGSSIKKGDVVAVINAVGLANEVHATVEGEVVEVLVADGQAVEYGQVLARVKCGN